MLIKIGKLVVENNEVFVGDPCYFGEGGTPHMVENFKLPNGVYNTYVEKSLKGDSKGHIMELFIVNESISNLDYLYEDTQGGVGVDSGQMGIFTHEDTKVSLQDLQDSLNKEFPYEDWKRNFTDTDTETDKFYKVCCNHTLSKDHFGNIGTIGVVSSSGFGDGFYRTYLLKEVDTDNVFGVGITFIESQETLELMKNL